MNSKDVDMPRLIADAWQLLSSAAGMLSGEHHQRQKQAFDIAWPGWVERAREVLEVESKPKPTQAHAWISLDARVHDGPLAIHAGWLDGNGQPCRYDRLLDGTHAYLVKSLRELADAVERDDPNWFPKGL